MSTTIASYMAITANMERSLATVAADPTHKRASERYLERVGGITSIDAFLADDHVFTYAMKAHGLDDMTYAKAFMRRILEEGIDQASSFANQLTDGRYRKFAETFNFSRHGSATMLFERTRSGTVALYETQMLEIESGQRNEGVRLALYFRRMAAEVENVYELLGDPALLRVAQTIAGLPSSTGALDIERQAELIEARIDIGDLADPEKLDRLLERFAVLWDAGGNANGSLPPSVQILRSDGFSDIDLSGLVILQGSGRN